MAFVEFSHRMDELFLFFLNCFHHSQMMQIPKRAIQIDTKFYFEKEKKYKSNLLLLYIEVLNLSVCVCVHFGNTYSIIISMRRKQFRYALMVNFLNTGYSYSIRGYMCVNNTECSPLSIRPVFYISNQSNLNDRIHKK